MFTTERWSHSVFSTTFLGGQLHFANATCVRSVSKPIRAMNNGCSNFNTGMNLSDGAHAF